MSDKAYESRIVRRKKKNERKERASIFVVEGEIMQYMVSSDQQLKAPSKKGIKTSVMEC